MTTPSRESAVDYTTGSFVENYAYDEANRRVDRWSGTTYDNVYFYGPNGKLLTVVQVNFNPTAPYVTATTLSNRIYFGKMLLGTTNGQVNTDSSLIKDRLGSVQPSYAYGTATGSGEQTSPGDDFATYWKDTSTGFEYAMNRYYSTGYGRFLTVDPFGGSARAADPGSMNRYSYAVNDPVNRRDPKGLDDSADGDVSGDLCDGPCFIAGSPADFPGDDGFDIGDTQSLGDYCAATFGQGATDPYDLPVCGGLSPVDQTGRMGTRKQNAAVSTVLHNLPAAIALAMQALQNPDCSGLMGTAPGSPSPSSVLADLQSGTGGFGFIAINNIDSPPGQVVSATTQIASFDNVPVDGGFQLQATSVIITVNDLAGNFVDGNTVEQAATLIHELGHAFYDLPALGGSSILPDAGNVAQSEANQALVMGNCFPTASQASQ